ncbi:MAG: DUF2281 domain-containing protein [Pseudomonadota bacterium]
MSISELFEKVKNLPIDKQAEVMDFVEFLAYKEFKSERDDFSTNKSPLKIFRNNPFIVQNFTPLSRDEANEH